MTHKKYKTYTLARLLITIAALIVAAVTLSLGREARAAQAGLVQGPAGSDTAYYTPNPAVSQDSRGTGAGEEGAGYYITIYKGRVGAFRVGEAEPVLTADTEVYLLPQEDLELLRRGLWVQTLNEARALLEDYD